MIERLDIMKNQIVAVREIHVKDELPIFFIVYYSSGLSRKYRLCSVPRTVSQFMKYGFQLPLQGSISSGDYIRTYVRAKWQNGFLMPLVPRCFWHLVHK